MEKKTAVSTKAVEKKVTEVSQYGHRAGTIAATMDQLIAEGTTIKHAASTIIKKFDQDEERAMKQFVIHVAYLVRERQVDISRKDDTIKGGKSYTKAIKAKIKKEEKAKHSNKQASKKVSF